jgi:hypothetical protein
VLLSLSLTRYKHSPSVGSWRYIVFMGLELVVSPSQWHQHPALPPVVYHMHWTGRAASSALMRRHISKLLCTLHRWASRMPSDPATRFPGLSQKHRSRSVSQDESKHRSVRGTRYNSFQIVSAFTKFSHLNSIGLAATLDSSCTTENLVIIGR